MDTETSKDQEVEKIKETDPKTDPETMKPEESEEKPNAARVSALDMILKSLSKISVFYSDFLLEFCQEKDHTLNEDGEYSVPPLRQLRDFLVNDLTLTDPLEEDGVFELFVNILDLLPRWRSGEEPLNSKFEVYEMAKKRCNRCKMDTEYPVERSYGLVLTAYSLREIKFAFKDFSFENILKIIMISLKMPCDKEGCEKQNYVHRMINKLPSVFTIALDWENNEAEEEIFATTSVLPTEIDISGIYKYEGDSTFAKYHLVSMVCLHGDQYSCVAYENKRWVRHFGTEIEVIGDWGSVLRTFVTQKIRPMVLFFEMAIGRGQIMGMDQTFGN